MVTRIDIQYKIPDSRAKVKLAQFVGLGVNGLTEVQVVDSYIIDASLNQKQLQLAVSQLSNPLVEKAFINVPAQPQQFTWAIEIGFLPGVTDNVGATARETLNDLLKNQFKPGQNVYTSQVYFLLGKVSKQDAQIISESLYNPLIQSSSIKSFAEFTKSKGFGSKVPKVVLNGFVKTLQVKLNVPHAELLELGKLGIKDSMGQRRGPLALDLDYLLAIKNYFNLQKRNPTDIELETLAQTWSEHCKHTIFASPLDEINEGLYKSYIKKATVEIRRSKGKKDFCASVFTDNSGAIVFDEKYLISHKVETHNTPSMLDPFGGAITGIVGVNRDCIGFGLGAKPVINTYGFCFASPLDAIELYRDKERSQKVLSAKRIMYGVIAGINSGGNCSGIPTPQGFVYFNSRYRGKPLVFAGTVGLIPKKIGKRESVKKQAHPGDYIVMVGGRVGADGIHGATFSSVGLNENSPATAVQIGDPITQKKLSDALIKEARGLGLYNSITDCGAGGLSSAVAEMAKESGGCRVELAKVPLKYSGLEPWQIWISESQERMVLAVPKNKWQKLFKLLKSRGVEAVVIGNFTSNGKCIVKYKNKTIVDLDLEFLHNGVPIRKLKSGKWKVESGKLHINQPKNLSETLKQMLGRLNLASFANISQQYDHEVQGTSVLKPLQGRGRVNGQASVIRPVLSSKKGVVLANGLYPSYTELDAYNMAGCSIDTAIRNSVACGGNVDYLALLDNFCWCSSNEPERLFQLKEAVRGCYDFATSFGTPFISGKDSMFNDFSGFDSSGRPIKISVPPTLLISTLGVVEDINKVVSEDLKFSGDLIYILGETHEELGGSEYVELMNARGGEIPRVNAARNLMLYRKIYKATQKNLLCSCISVTRGGLGVALAKTAMAGGLGIDVALGYLPGEVLRDDFALFSESQGRLVVSVNPKNRHKFEQLMAGTAYQQVGRVTQDKNIIIRNRVNKTIVKLRVEHALHAYRETLNNL